MSASDDQERLLQQCIDTMWGNAALRSMLTGGFERITGNARPRDLRFPKPTPLPVKAPSDPPLATLFESTVTITLPDYDSAVREPTLDEIKALRGKVDEWHNGLLDELLGGPIHNGVARPPCDHKGLYCQCIVNTASSGMTLTADDFMQAYQTMLRRFDPPDPYPPSYASLQGAGFAINARDPYGPYGGGPPPVAAESVMAECRGHGCMEVREEYDFAGLQTIYTHIGPHYERREVAVPDRSMTGSEVRAFLLEWLRSIHGEASMPGPLERSRCYLCGQERDPDVEPVMLELPSPGPPFTSGPTVEACSRECATAHAIKLQPMRTQPKLGQFFEQRHAERIAQLGNNVTDSAPGLKHNPWADEPETNDDEVVVTTQEYGVWTIGIDPAAGQARGCR